MNIHLMDTKGVHLPLGTDSINLVNEDNAWRVFLRHTEQFSHELGAVSEVFLYKLGTNHAKEGC